MDNASCGYLVNLIGSVRISGISYAGDFVIFAAGVMVGFVAVWLKFPFTCPTRVRRV